ncbi:MAG: sulfurtransferase [Legionellales bacterium]|nr:sulfurtransferase [Legionellales bacterium]
MTYLNIAAYKFVTIQPENLTPWRDALKLYTRSQGLRGTILLSPEGINLFMAGPENKIRDFQIHLATFSGCENLIYKESFSDTQPFSRMLVKIKEEIIAFGQDNIEPAKQTAPYVSPQEFKQWYENNKDMIVVDTRNDYEYRVGTFKNAVDLHIQHFRQFPEAIQHLEDCKDKTIVTFCTGGIRCEKAAEFMRQQGFNQVYQLEGGILNYFEQCGGDFYEGECFVFDKRVALDPNLQESATIQCYACRNPLTKDDQENCQGICPYCHDQTIGQRLVSADAALDTVSP